MSRRSPVADPEDVGVEYDSSGKRMIKLSNLATQSEGCESPETFSGVIASVIYDQDLIQGFTLDMPNGRRKAAYLDENKLSNADGGWLYTLIAKGKRVRIVVYPCGSGGIWTLNSVQALGPAK